MFRMLGLELPPCIRYQDALAGMALLRPHRLEA